jgi:hypothetical protein
MPFLLTKHFMPIPALTDEGYLPEGIHDCTLQELQERFGSFQGSDTRCRLFDRLAAFVRAARNTGFVEAIIVDGSFVTAINQPNDIDLIVVLPANHDFSASLRPFEYNLIARSQARRVFHLDTLVARRGADELARYIELFSQIRDRVDVRKGMLRVSL